MRSDIDRCKRQVARLDLTGIDLAAFSDDPLAPEVLRCLRHMHDVEHHTEGAVRRCGPATSADVVSLPTGSPVEPGQATAA